MKKTIITLGLFAIATSLFAQPKNEKIKVPEHYKIYMINDTVIAQIDYALGETFKGNQYEPVHEILLQQHNAQVAMPVDSIAVFYKLSNKGIDTVAVKYEKMPGNKKTVAIKNR